MGKRKYIETPEKLWELFLQYKKESRENPILVQDFVGKDAELVHREKQRPLTLEGFENWCSDNEIIENLDNYFANSNEAYSDYSSICTRIRKNIRQDQIEGGMVGIYNPSITQRLNSLVEKQEISVSKDIDGFIIEDK